MRTSYSLSLALFIFAMFCPESRLYAKNVSTVTVSAAGESYQGPPEFRLLADGKVIGQGRLSNAVETSTGSHLDTSERALQGQVERFEFAIEAIETINVLEIEYSNDLWAGAGKPGDRNLYVVEVSLKHQRETSQIRFGPAYLKPVVDDLATVEVAQNYIALYANGKLRLERPQEGWFRTSVVSTSATPAVRMSERLHAERMPNLSPPGRPVLNVEHVRRKASSQAVTTAGAVKKRKQSLEKATYKKNPKSRRVAKYEKKQKKSKLSKKKAKARTVALRADTVPKITKKKKHIRKKSVAAAKKRSRKKRVVAEENEFFGYYDAIPPMYAPYIAPGHPNFARYDWVRRTMRRRFRARIPVYISPY